MITWTGSSRDFFSLGKNPDLSKSERTTKTVNFSRDKICCPSQTIIRKIALRMPWPLHNFCNGLKIDVKICRAEESSKGITQNWKYIGNPVAKIPNKSEKFSVAWENINVVITRLKVKFKQVIITIKWLCSDAQIFQFKLLPVCKLVVKDPKWAFAVLNYR